MTLTIDPLRILRRVLLGLLACGWLLGVALAYHFYWPTQVTSNGKHVNRAQLIDWVIDRELQRAK